MPATARTKGFFPRRAAERPRIVDGVAALEFGNILDEIGMPPLVHGKAGLDDVISEIAAPAQGEPGYSLEDILREFDAPASAANSLEEIQSVIAPMAEARFAKSFDDILDTIAPPKATDNIDVILGDVAMPADAGGDGQVNEIPPVIVDETAEAAAPAKETEGVETKRRLALPRLPGLPNLSGKREISRKALVGLVGLAGLFALIAVAEAAFILARGDSHNDNKRKTVVVSKAPANYADIDLKRYIGKRRVLHKGGRDVLRNSAVRTAILELDNGEDLYRDIRGIAQRSPVADRLAIGDNRLTLSSCEAGICGDKSFRLVYDLVRKHASVCMTEKYLNNSYLSYSYDDIGYREVAGCR